MLVRRFAWSRRLVCLPTPLTVEREGARSQPSASLPADSHAVTLLPRGWWPSVIWPGQRGDLSHRAGDLPQAFAGNGGCFRVGLLALDALQLEFSDCDERAPKHVDRTLRRCGQEFGALHCCSPFPQHSCEVAH